MNIITYNQLLTDVKNSLWLFAKYDLIVFIPRSGMMVAGIVSGYTNIRVTSLDSFLKNEIYSNTYTKLISNNDIKKILLVDDSVSTGNSFGKSIDKIMVAKASQFKIDKYAVYATHEGASKVDYYSRIIEKPRYFEWNLFHTKHAFDFAFDLDGVLCHDPDKFDKKKYDNFIKNAKVKIKPTYKVGLIVTGRHEKYRSGTEQWLNDNNFKYEKLVMYDSDEKHNDVNHQHAILKAKSIKNNNHIKLYIESSVKQAKIISSLVSIPILCIDDGKIYFKYNDEKIALNEYPRKRNINFKKVYRFFKHNFIK